MDTLHETIYPNLNVCISEFNKKHKLRKTSIKFKSRKSLYYYILILVVPICKYIMCYITSWREDNIKYFYKLKSTSRLCLRAFSSHISIVKKHHLFWIVHNKVTHKIVNIYYTACYIPSYYLRQKDERSWLCCSKT